MIKRSRRAVLIFLLTAPWVFGHSAYAQDAQPQKGLPIAPPPPVVEKPGGDDNKSAYEFVPEKQPTWVMPPANSEAEACFSEVAILRDRLAEMEGAVYGLQSENRALKAQIGKFKKQETSAE